VGRVGGDPRAIGLGLGAVGLGLRLLDGVVDLVLEVVDVGSRLR
jgi:hypothetical protein